MRKYALAFLFLTAVSAQADKAIDIQDAWIRHIPGDRPMAGYFVVHNKGSVERTLVGASSIGFAAVEMHESVEGDGTTSMRPVESVTVPAVGQVEFQPGGYHLMLMQRQRDLQVGDRIPVTLEFEDGGSQAAVFEIKPSWQE